MVNFKPEFSEAQFQSLVEDIFITDFRPGKHFEINYYSGTEENELGYDIEIKTFIPIFLQVKRSVGYFDIGKNDILDQRRDEYHYKDNPMAYYYKLHVDGTAKDYLQHNLLYDLSSGGNYARYIAPLFISRKLIQFLKYNVPTIGWNGPYHQHMIDSGIPHNWRDYFSFLHSIIIAPHKRVNKVKGELHKYFYNRRAETSFHSVAEKIDGGSSVVLNEFIEQVNTGIQQDQGKSIRTIFEEIRKALKRLLSDYDGLERREIQFLNYLSEEDTEEIGFSDFDQLEPNMGNFILLCGYLEKRFQIKTLLAGKIQAHSVDLP